MLIVYFCKYVHTYELNFTKSYGICDIYKRDYNRRLVPNLKLECSAFILIYQNSLLSNKHI